MLNAVKVRNAKPGRHSDGHVRGLHLLVSPSGARSWVLRMQVLGRRRDIGLGGWPDIDLEAARDQARRLRTAAKTGRDPIAERDRDRIAIPTFKEAAESYHDAKKSGWSKRNADRFISALRLHVFAQIGGLRVDSIEERDIAAVLAPIWTTKPDVGRKLRHAIFGILDFAKAQRWRLTGGPREGVKSLLSKQPRGGNFASMPYVDVPAFFVEQSGKPDTAGRLALLFTIATAARSGEVRAAMWSHIDLGAKLWRRPGELMKGGKAHDVTLSPAAVALLVRAKALRSTIKDAPVFPGAGGRKLSDMTMSKIVKPLGYTVHGFRSSFRDWAAELMPTIPDPVAEAALAHVVPDAVVAAYKRTSFVEMRRKLLDAWSAYLTGETSVIRLAV